jgi:hypothetical protein
VPPFHAWTCTPVRLDALPTSRASTQDALHAHASGPLATIQRDSQSSIRLLR